MRTIGIRRTWGGDYYTQQKKKSDFFSHLANYSHFIERTSETVVSYPSETFYRCLPLPNR